MLQAIDRVSYVSATDDEALEALEELCELEGVLTALETAHAYAAAKRWSRDNPGKRVLIGNSGRGDKDMPTLNKFPPRTRRHAGA
jgi:tryptophan synthase beta subunit